MKRVLVPVFEAMVLVFTDKDEVGEFMAASIPGEAGEWRSWAGMTCAVTDLDGFAQHILCVFDGRRNTAIHEAAHCAQYLMQHIGIKPQKPDEVHAALTAYLAEQVLDLLDNPQHEESV